MKKDTGRIEVDFQIPGQIRIIILYHVNSGNLLRNDWDTGIPHNVLAVTFLTIAQIEYWHQLLEMLAVESSEAESLKQQSVSKLDSWGTFFFLPWREKVNAWPAVIAPTAQNSPLHSYSCLYSQPFCSPLPCPKLSEQKNTCIQQGWIFALGHRG